MQLVQVQPNQISFASEPEGEDKTLFQLIRVGDFHFGEGKITAEMIGQMVENFAANATRLSLDGRAVLPINYSHNMWGEAAGWITSVEARDDNTSLWFTAEWNAEAKEAIKGRKYAFISAEIHPSYRDSETGEKYGAALLGAGLTNIPEVRDMDQIKLNHKKNEVNMATEKENQTKESAYNERIIAFEKKEKEMSEKIAKMEAEAAKAAKEQRFSAMLSEGKVCEAQRAAFMAGDMEAFAANASPMVFSEKKSKATTDEGGAIDFNSPEYDKLICARLKDKGVSFSNTPSWYQSWSDEHLIYQNELANGGN